jgi:hypothetical protein
MCKAVTGWTENIKRTRNGYESQKKEGGKEGERETD